MPPVRSGRPSRLVQAGQACRREASAAIGRPRSPLATRVAQRDILGPEAQDVGNHHGAPGARGGINYALTIGEGQRQRLLAEDVLAVFDGAHGGSRMLRRGQADADRVNPVVIQDVVLTRGPGGVEFGGQWRGCRLVGAKMLVTVTWVGRRSNGHGYYP